MSVLDGYNKYKRYIKTNDGYKLCSQWTSSNTVQMDDGNTLQTNLGAINGITDSLTATSSNIAASAAAVKTLNDSFSKINIKIITKTAKSKGIGNWLTFNINFGVTFKSTPLVSVHGTTPFSTENIKATSISTTGCIVEVYAPNTTFDYGVRVQAIGLV